MEIVNSSKIQLFYVFYYVFYEFYNILMILLLSNMIMLINLGMIIHNKNNKNIFFG